MGIFIRTFTLLVLISGFCFAQSGKEIIESLRKKYASIDDAVVKFEQTVKYGVSKFEQSFSGTFYFKKKNKYRIETDQQIVVTDGVTSWLYSKVNNQVIIDKYREDKDISSPEKFLLSISDEYIPVILRTERNDGKKVYILKLTPRDENSSIESAKIWIVEGDLQITRVEITDISGTVTIYSVKSIKINSGVEDSIFKFSIPSGVKVVDLR
jgi:outer membrane lipoprotein carrier protein